MSLEKIKRFRVPGSHCAGHPEIDQGCGITPERVAAEVRARL